MVPDRVRSLNAGWLSGWSLTGMLSLAVSLMAVGIAASYQFDVEGMRAVIRATARTSLLFFCLAFSAAALHQLWPNDWTRWQRRNRRYLGVAFGVSHGVHAIAIVSLILVAPDLFGSAASTDMLIFGGLGYAFIIAMVATSFDRTAAMLGPRAWRVLHWTSAHFIWLSFIATFGKRTGANPAHWSFIAILLAVMTLRLIAWRRSSARARASAGLRA